VALGIVVWIIEMVAFLDFVMTAVHRETSIKMSSAFHQS